MLITKPLHRWQFAYQAGKSTETALHLLVNSIEKSIDDKEITVCIFIDIEGAFDNTTYDSISIATLSRGIDESTSDWIKSMLLSRKITAELGGTKKTVKAIKGCPQGGVLSPLLWSLVVDDLLFLLNDSGFRAQGYADDLVIEIKGKHMDTISDLVQTALGITKGWCNSKGLSINPQKTTIVPFTRKHKIDGLRKPILDGVEIAYSDEAKYLGVTLDRKLNFTSHIENVTKKARSSIGICRQLVIKSWGLDPDKMIWLYNMIVKPILTYGSFIWWTKTLNKNTQSTLSKLQRQAIIATTGALKSTPTAAMEMLLNVTPLHIHVKQEAIKSILRLKSFHSPVTHMGGHMRILQEIKDQPTLLMDTDKMIRKYDFEKKFQTNIPSREDWKNGIPVLNGFNSVWYTDGSKTPQGIGAGVFGPRCNIVQPMGKFTTVFQAEIHAIELCASRILERKLQSQRIAILSDSQAALKALTSFEIDSNLVWNCLERLNLIGNTNRLTLMWIPGHSGFDGNEKADELARKASSSEFIGPEPYCRISPCMIKSAVKCWGDKLTLDYWNTTPGQALTKRILPSPSKRLATKLIQLSRNNLRILISLLTGHCRLNYHLTKIGLSTQTTCRICLEEDETAEHILGQCFALARIRLKYLGSDVICTDSFAKLNPEKILRFIESTELRGKI